MTRTMYDSINPLAIPSGAPMVAGYVNGRYAWPAVAWGRFASAVRVTISVQAVDAGDVLDVEAGDAAPAQTAGWIAMRKAAGLYCPTIYCSLATVPAVRQGTGRFILGQDYDLWIADWDGTAVIPYPHAAAKQYRNTPGYDVSVVFDDGWPHRTRPPARPTLAQAQAAIITLTEYIG